MEDDTSTARARALAQMHEANKAGDREGMYRAAFQYAALDIDRADAEARAELGLPQRETEAPEADYEAGA